MHELVILAYDDSYQIPTHTVVQINMNRYKYSIKSYINHKSDELILALCDCILGFIQYHQKRSQTDDQRNKKWCKTQTGEE